MAAELGNKHWQLRSKHGRDKLFSSPEMLWEAATEYFQWCDANPWNINEQLKQKPIIPKDSGLKAEEIKEMLNPIVHIPTSRPYTISGFCLYVDCSQQTFFNYAKDKEYKDFFDIITRIRECIETQQFEGATVGVFNPNIIARKLGLIDKTDHTSSDGSMTPLIVVSSKKTESELKKLIDE